MANRMRWWRLPLALLTLLFLLGPLIVPWGSDGVFAYHDPESGDQGHPSTQVEPPDQTHPPSDPNRTKKGDDPIDVASGNFIHEQVDLLLRGRIPLQIKRTYNCQDMLEGPFGFGWTFTYQIALVEVKEGSQTWVIISREGKRLTFKDNGDGTYTSPSGYFQNLVKTTGGWRLIEKTGERHEFNASGQFTAFIDRHGNAITLTYDGKGRLATVRDQGGRMLSFAYGSNNKVATITDPGGRVLTYGYNAKGNLTTFTDPAGNTIQYAYDDKNRMTSITDPRGTTFLTNVYDEKNRVTTQTFNGATSQFCYYDGYTQMEIPGSGWSTYYYNESGNLTKVVDPLGNTTERTWDSNRRLTSFKDAKGNVTTFGHDAQGNVTTITDAKGNVTNITYHPVFNKPMSVVDALGRTIQSFEYDEKGNATKVTDAVGNSLSFTFDTNGDCLSMTDPYGNQTAYGYDAYGRLITVTNPLSQTTTYVYDILGNLLEKRDHRGKSTFFIYDILGRLTKVTDPVAGHMEFTYDANGNRTSMTDALGHVTTYEYTIYNQPKKIIDALGNEFSFSYDTAGNLVSTKDARGNTATKAYDGLGRVIRETDEMGVTTHYTYDPNGKLLSIQDGRNNVTAFEYDEVDQPVKIVFPDGSTEEYTYDAVRNLVQKKDRKGNVSTNSFDVLGRLTTKTYPDTSSLSFTYDAMNRLVSLTGPSGTLGYVYDALGRMIESNQNGTVVRYTYNDSANSFTLHYPNGYEVTYSYNDSNQLQKIEDSNGSILLQVSRDTMGRRTGIDLADGALQSLSTFDGKSNLLSLVNRTSGGISISSFGHTYDPNGNRLTATTPQGSYSYTYDKVDRLTKVTRPDLSTITYNLDSVGNRTSVVSGGVTTNYTVNNLNQYTHVGGTAFSYDLNGNLLSDGTNSYEYDYEDRLTRVTTAGGTVTYGYDGHGRRISKTTPGGVTRYIYDRDQVIMETDGLGNPTAIYVSGEAIDEVVMMIRGSNTYYYLYDPLGSVATLVSPTGTVVESYSYDAFGQPGGPSSVGNPFLFTGREYDSETGLYFYRARTYHPILGRFLQTDPIGHGREVNLYTYCWNNPLLFKDPMGLDWLETWADLVDVRAARQQWQQWAQEAAGHPNPVLGFLGYTGAKTMDFFAGMVQFAQDDAEVMGYHGITSPKGRRALGDFLFNSALMISSVPGVPGAASKVITNGAAKFLPAGGSKLLGNLNFVARFREVPGLSFTAKEPIWVGVEKIVQGSAQGRGLIHVGVAPPYGGAHLGLNFLNNTHIYMSHIWIGTQNGIGIPLGISARGIMGQFTDAGQNQWGRPDP